LESELRVVKPKMRPAPSVRWAVEDEGILVIDTGSGASHFLGYPDAAVWDLLARDYSGSRLARMLCLIGAFGWSESQRLIDTLLAEWETAGLLLRDLDHG
jgi:hypothetical protein